MSVYTDVRKLIADKIAADEDVLVERVVREIMSAYSDIEGSNVPFYVEHTSARLREIVKRCVSLYDNRKSEPDGQLVLEGFEYLQVAYTVVRDDVTVLVPIKRLSDEELERRAAEFDANAKGLRAHAREIRGFIKSRSPAHAHEGDAA